MTEDPVKLYVVVMAILLCVLGFVAWSSYEEANAFEEALARAPHEAELLKELASGVSAQCEQLGQSKLRKGHKTLILEAATIHGLTHTRFQQMKDERVGRGRKGKKKRFSYTFGTSRASKPATREQLARFCQAVERDSQGILKTLEIKLTRVTGPGQPSPGKQEKVVKDLYKGTILFGYQVIE